MVGDRSTAGRRRLVSTRPAASSRRGSSTCTPTCASPGARRPRPSRPAAAPRRSAGSRRSWRCRTPSRRPDVAAWSSSCGRRASGPGSAMSTRPAASRSAATASSSPPRRAGGAGVRLFTDDGDGVQDPLLMRRAMEYARGLDMALAQHCEVAALTARRSDARGAVLQRARAARVAGAGGRADGAP